MNLWTYFLSVSFWNIMNYFVKNSKWKYKGNVFWPTLITRKYAPLTLPSGPLKVDWLGWLKYWRLLLEYLRKVSAVLRAKVQAFKKASFCSWCLLINCVIKVTLSMSFEVRCFWSMSSSLRYSLSRLSRTEQTWK